MVGVSVASKDFYWNIHTNGETFDAGLTHLNDVLVKVGPEPHVHCFFDHIAWGSNNNRNKR